MAVGGAKLALLLIHILGVAGNGYSSLQENNYGSDDHEHRKKLISSLKSGNKVMMKTPMMTSLMERQEKKRKEANIQISTSEKLIARISFAELQKATNSFDRGKVIGVGKTGTVYKAAHPHLRFTAVKRLFDFQHLEEQFLSELVILGKFRHKNIVPLLGFCLESRERLLVYQYMPNGNLYDWLHPVKGEPKNLEWHLRVNIAVGIARGLARLHNHNSLQLAHLNLSSSCILLDKHFEPRISNFGRAMHIMTSNARIFMANIEMGEWDLTKRDVHQLGVLLLELVTGEDPLKNSEFYQSLEGKLVQNNCLLTVSAALYCAVEKSLLGQGFDREVLDFLKVACNCIQPIPNRRPTMVEVYKINRTAVSKSIFSCFYHVHLLLFFHLQKLALLSIHILSVAGNGYSSLYDK
ncbi:hypothetical protein Peur_025900 [Populus x canadensis]